MKTFITFLLSLFILVSGASLANASDFPTNACVNEDGSRQAEDGSYYTEDCYWDAANRGNGIGQSFYLVDGVVTPTNGQPVVQECTEGYALAEDGTCVPLGYWDTTEPVALAPATDPTVTAYVPPVAVTVPPVAVTASPVVPVATQSYTEVPVNLSAVEAQAWMMWDATNAASLLPNHETRVSFIGANSTGFPYLSANMVTVWDMQGNHYLFSY